MLGKSILFKMIENVSSILNNVTVAAGQFSKPELSVYKDNMTLTDSC